MSEPDAQPPLSFSEFRTSFSYGSRNDLNFKFLKSLPDDEAAEFLRRLLDELGDAFDTGDIRALIDAAVDAQIAGYAATPDNPRPPQEFEDGPFTPMAVPLADARVGLLNSGGHFVAGDDPRPFGIDGMTQADAVDRISDFLKDTPILSEIPSSLPREQLVTRHGGYDITSALLDRNVCLPMERLAEACDDGTVGSLADTYFSFPGATAHGRLRRELPGWVDRMTDEDLDVLLLVPV